MYLKIRKYLILLAIVNIAFALLFFLGVGLIFGMNTKVDELPICCKIMEVSCISLLMFIVVILICELIRELKEVKII